MKHTILIAFVLSLISFMFFVPASAEATEGANATSVVLVIDTSSSMSGTPMSRVKDAARNFVVSMDDDVPIAIATFANRAELLQDYTTNKADLLTTLNDLTPNGVTALYDGAMMGVQHALQSPAENRVVILLSDGAEYGGQSQAAERDAIILAQTYDIAVYSVGLGFGADRSYLEEIAAQTNGAFYSADTAMETVDIYAQLSVMLSNRTESIAQTPPAPPVVQSEIIQQPSTTILINNVPGQTDQPIIDTENGREVAVAPSGDDAETASPAPVVDGNATISDTAIVLTIDVSQSMWGTPINSTIEAVQTFLRDVDPNIPVALVTFSNEAQVIHDFTTDRAALLQAVGDLTPFGVTALYDGALLSVELAASSEVANPVVVMLSDGGEYGGQSAAGRDDALLMAQALGVSVKTVAYGFGVDRSYLNTLASVNDGSLYEVSDRDALMNVYADLSQMFVAADESLVSNSPLGVAIEPLPVTGANDDFGASALAQPEFPLATDTMPEFIAPLNGEIAALDLNSDTPAVEAGAAAESAASSAGTEETTTIAPETLEERDVDPISHIMPVTIEVADSVDVETATVFINDYEIARFTEPPYTFDLDTLMLSSGLYHLAFEVRTPSDVVSEGRIPFEVTLATPAPQVGAMDSASIGNDVPTTSNTSLPASDASAAQRILTIDGEEQAFNFAFSPLTGLSVKAPVVPVEQMMASQTLGEILLRPLQIIPEPVQEFIMTPRPNMVTAIIIIMTIVLLPQGLFTIYWMTYTWVNPERLEESSSPKEFYEPEKSFTALLPARKEAAVIYDTIMTVNNIDYPEHLKETLVLIRDEDDDATIEATNRAINDIRQSYWDRGEEYPDNVHLVTFTDGPYNKPNGLNRGYAAATKEVICIFDAEDQPHPDIYNVINTVMIRDNADVVQSGVQLMNFQSKWFSALNCLEYFFWFKSGLHAFTHALNVTPLGGNTVFFKKTWLDELAKEDVEKGYRVWDEAGLTEDADIGIRLTEMGANIQIVYDAVQATREETPDSVEQFIKQRTRWNQGFYQIFAKGIWRKLPTFKQRVTAIYILLNSLLQAAIMLFLPIGIFIAMTQEVSVPIAMLSYLPIYILIVQLMLNVVGIKEFTEAYDLKLPFLFRLKMLLTFYPFQLLLSASAARAIGRFITNQSSWEKTTHSNLHRQSVNVNPAGA